ncbi:MAG: DUF2164 domain-containing protein [Pleurocapsa sp. MO_226.B13]|nr:DUF2164 domain-containing protein [Pleurocapsa sp. MO_226.B13]
MTIKLSKETKQQLIESIKRYFEVEMDEEIGDLKASLFLDFCLQEICPSVYNQAIMDAQSYLNNRVSDLGDTCYEPEFGYWKQ